MSERSKIEDSPRLKVSRKAEVRGQGPDLTEVRVESLLELLGIESLHHLDVLVFLHRHQSSLTSADQIARLLGYETKAVINAVHTLETSGLVKRSRVSQGTRLYEVSVPEDSPKRNAFSQLMSLASTRAGRLRILNELCSSNTGRDKVQPLFGGREGVPRAQ